MPPPPLRLGLRVMSFPPLQQRQQQATDGRNGSNKNVKIQGDKPPPLPSPCRMPASQDVATAGSNSWLISIDRLLRFASTSCVGACVWQFTPHSHSSCTGGSTGAAMLCLLPLRRSLASTNKGLEDPRLPCAWMCARPAGPPPVWCMHGCQQCIGFPGRLAGCRRRCSRQRMLPRQGRHTCLSRRPIGGMHRTLRGKGSQAILYL